MYKCVSKKIVGGVLIAACMTAMSVYALTVDEWNKTVVTVGTSAPALGFVTFAEGTNSNCIYQNIYFDISTPLGRSFQTTLLAAKALNKKVRVVYSVPTTVAMCNLELAAVL